MEADMGTTTHGNVLLVSNYASDVGYAWWLMEHFWVLISEHFHQKGKKAYLAYPEINTLPDRIQQSRISVVELNVPGRSSQQRHQLREFISTHNITDIYFTDRPWFSPDYLFFRRCGIRNIVVHDHTPGDRPPVTGLKGALKSIRHRLPWVCANTQFCVSDLMKQRSIANARIPPERCIVVQNGIPPMSYDTHQRAASRQRLGIPDNAFVCITTGRAHPYKRFDFVIAVAELAVQALPAQQLTFLLIGDGPAMNHLQQLVEDKNLQDTVRLLGFRSDARELLPAADIAFHAALGEGFSLSIVEYMTASLPVLVPDIPSVKQAIDHGENGFVYGKDDVQDAAGYVVKLASDHQLRAQLGSSAREKSTVQYTLDSCSRAFLTACSQAFS
ncbi:glycosyltransferase family 4 protein [Marinobacter sp.]|uniref:glycosyltransferase family 4 protein n=1 Tax=Marinobacter sp. TaxID=50741 RepID=UPI0034A5393C